MSQAEEKKPFHILNIPTDEKLLILCIILFFGGIGYAGYEKNMHSFEQKCVSYMESKK